MASQTESVITFTTNTSKRLFMPGPSQITVDVGGGATVTAFGYTDTLGAGAAMIDSRTGSAYSTTADDIFEFGGGYISFTVAGIVGTVTIVGAPIRVQTIPG